MPETERGRISVLEQRNPENRRNHDALANPENTSSNEFIGAVEKIDRQFVKRLEEGCYRFDESNLTYIPTDFIPLEKDLIDKIHIKCSEDERKEELEKLFPNLSDEDKMEKWKKNFVKKVNEYKSKPSEDGKSRFAIFCGGQNVQSFVEQEFTEANADAVRERFFEKNGKEKTDISFAKFLEEEIYKKNKDNILQQLREDQNGWLLTMAQNLYGADNGYSLVKKFTREMTKKYGTSEEVTALDEGNGNFADAPLIDSHKNCLKRLEKARKALEEDVSSRDEDISPKAPEGTPPPIPEGEPRPEDLEAESQTTFIEARKNLFKDIPRRDMVFNIFFNLINANEFNETKSLAGIEAELENITTPLEKLEYLSIGILGRGLDTITLKNLENKTNKEMLNSIVSTQEYDSKRTQYKNLRKLHQDIFGENAIIDFKKMEEHMAGLILGQTYAEIREELVQSDKFKQQQDAKERKERVVKIYEILIGKLEDHTNIDTNPKIKSYLDNQELQTSEQIINNILTSNAYKEKLAIEQEVMRMFNSTTYSHSEGGTDINFDFDCEPDFEDLQHFTQEVLKKLTPEEIELVNKRNLSHEENYKKTNALNKTAREIHNELMTKDIYKRYKQKLKQLERKRTEWENQTKTETDIHAIFNQELDAWKEPTLEVNKNGQKSTEHFLKNRENIRRENFDYVQTDNLIIFFPKETEDIKETIRKKYSKISRQVNYDTTSRLIDQQLTPVFLLPPENCNYSGYLPEQRSIIIKRDGDRTLDDFRHEKVHAAIHQTKGLSPFLDAEEGAAQNLAKQITPTQDSNGNRDSEGKNRLVEKRKITTDLILSSLQIATSQEIAKIETDQKVGRTLYYLSYMFGDMFYKIIEAEYGSKAKKMFLVFMEQCRSHAVISSNKSDLDLKIHALEMFGIDRNKARNAQDRWLRGEISDQPGDIAV